MVYDATIQGSFLNTESPVTFGVVPIKFTAEIGYRYRYKRYRFGYTFHFHSKKVKNPIVETTNTYGSIYIGYAFN